MNLSAVWRFLTPTRARFYGARGSGDPYQYGCRTTVATNLRRTGWRMICKPTARIYQMLQSETINSSAKPAANEARRQPLGFRVRRPEGVFRALG